jgi:hypothetical protein
MNVIEMPLTLTELPPVTLSAARFGNNHEDDHRQCEHVLPRRVRRLLHRSVAIVTDPGHAGRKAGRGKVRATVAGQPV